MRNRALFAAGALACTAVLGAAGAATASTTHLQPSPPERTEILGEVLQLPREIVNLIPGLLSPQSDSGAAS